MFLRVTLAAADREASRRFYETILPELEIDDWQDFSLAAGPPVTRGLHIGFAAPSREHVDAFWRVGTETGYRDDGAPGPRPQYGPDYYVGFLLDPDGNSAEAVHHGSLRTGGIVDHLWIRVADVDASQAFYEELGPRPASPSDGAPRTPSARSSPQATARSRSSRELPPRTCTLRSEPGAPRP